MRRPRYRSGGGSGDRSAARRRNTSPVNVLYDDSGDGDARQWKVGQRRRVTTTAAAVATAKKTDACTAALKNNTLPTHHRGRQRCSATLGLLSRSAAEFPAESQLDASLVASACAEEHIQHTLLWSRRHTRAIAAILCFFLSFLDSVTLF